ncbi:caspase family protein [Rhizobium sp. CB3090]|uniref:caspase family protein n=1 Tax=Rhizobium sp. CB3090 TaxID=3039156 RepID=UPI0024B1C5AC|nr:caspase family protein [Rhizobium sp. CB3090]WFU10672.1 caspase family protein [Rhizobium sp. CB3090]
MSPMRSMMGSSFRKTIRAFIAMMLVLAGIAVASAAIAQDSPEKRIALVVGNAAYQAGALPTPANDAGLIAQTLQAAGFDVIGARDLDQNGLRDAMRDFLTKANASGPNTVVFVYLAGYGVQYQGDNYFVPVDAQIAKATDVPVQALRISDFTKSLAAINNRGSIVVLDAARANPFVQSDQPLAGGLALVEPDANQLIAFNAAPGTVAPQEAGPYGSYAHALAEMIRVGGLSLGDVFDRTRLRVSDLTKGAQISWDASKFNNAFTFFDRGPNAPAAQVSSYDSAAIRTKAIRDFDERDAYFAALDRDTMQGYEDFLAAYPHDPMAKRVRAIIAARREAITWRETWTVDTPEAYWSYLRRYPRGPHVWDARRRLEHFDAALEPPPSFTVIEYDVPPPPPPEIVYVDRRVLYFDDADFGFAPPPPEVFLAPPPRDFVDLAPPKVSDDLYVLPAPVFVPVPNWVEPPRDVAPPQNNVIFNNIHNTTVNNTTVNENGTAPAAPGLTTGQKLGGAAVIAGAGAAALHAALPPSVQKKAAVLQKQNPAPAAKTAPATGPAAAPSVQPQGGNAAHALPGASGKPLPPAGKLPNNQAAPQTKQAQQPQVAPNAVQNPTAAARRGATAHALPGSKGQPLPPAGNAPAVKGQNPIARTPAPQAAPIVKPNAAPSVKPNSAVAAPKPNAPGQPVKPKAVPQVSNQPHIAATPQRHVNPSVAQPKPPVAQPKPVPHVAAQPRAPAPKVQAQPRPQPQPQPRVMQQRPPPAPKPQAQPRPQPQPQPKVMQQQAKRPPPAPQKPPEKKKCGAPGLPACQ